MLLKKKNHQQDQDKLTKEINTEIRMERIKAKLKKHKKIIAYILIAILLLLIAVTAFNIYQKSQEEKYSAILQQALIDTEKGNNNDAKSALKKLYENSTVPGIKSLASLKYAASLLNDEKLDEALDVYLKTNKNKKFDSYVRELSGLLALKLMIDSNDGSFNEKIVSLEKELEKSSKTLKYFVIEQKAIFEWNQKNYDVAGAIFKDLASNPEVSGSLKAHSKEMSDIYSSKYSTKDSVDKKSEVRSDESKAVTNQTNK